MTKKSSNTDEHLAEVSPNSLELTLENWGDTLFAGCTPPGEGIAMIFLTSISMVLLRQGTQNQPFWMLLCFTNPASWLP